MFYDLIYVLVNFLSMNSWMPLHIASDWSTYLFGQPNILIKHLQILAATNKDEVSVCNLYTHAHTLIISTLNVFQAPEIIWIYHLNWTFENM